MYEQKIFEESGSIWWISPGDNSNWLIYHQRKLHRIEADKRCMKFQMLQRILNPASIWSSQLSFLLEQQTVPILAGLRYPNFLNIWLYRIRNHSSLNWKIELHFSASINLVNHNIIPLAKRIIAKKSSKL